MGGCASAQPEHIHDNDQEMIEVIELMRGILEKRVLYSLVPDDEVVSKFSGSRSTTLDFSEPDQTIIIFDWDDTLCPWSWCRRRGWDGSDGQASWIRHQYERELRVLATWVAEVLTKAQQLGKVVIVTNASRGWVPGSCEKLMPEAKAVLQDIPVIYAMRLLTDAEKKTLDSISQLTEAKVRAMQKTVSEFYSRHKGQHWKNIVSIGDGRYEYEAVHQIAKRRREGMVKPSKCRAKTIKLLERPTLAHMNLQLSILSRWLPSIVNADSNIDIDFGE